ncbi:MAG: PQQ-binding-like beta-propeller repeat protein [Thermoguttaceae bacterium]
MARNQRDSMALKAGSLLAVVIVVALAARLPAQFNLRRLIPSPANQETVESYFPAPPRDKLKLLSDARKLLAENRLGEAIRKLGDLLESPEDHLVQLDKKSPVHSSLKKEAERLLGDMPREGRELYELQYGARARQLLSEALDAGDMERVAEVSRRFFHTKAGYQATFLLGQDHFDRGRPMAGALVLQRLRGAGSAVNDLEPTLSLTLASCWLSAGMPDKARAALTALRARDPATRITVAGRERPLFEKESRAVEWLTGLIGPQVAAVVTELDRWWMFRGNPARNASAAGGAPLLSLQWRVEPTDDPTTASALSQRERSSVESGVPILPSFHPLAVGDVILMRTLETLVAVDFATGKQLWRVPVDDSVEGAAGATSDDSDQSAEVGGQRLWRDMTFGTLSSDGRRVYSIEDMDADLGRGVQFGGVNRRVWLGNVRMAVAFNQQGEPVAGSNRLTAHDIRNGKLVWDLGGPAGPNALPQAETFFLGPPLPLAGQLFVIAETKGEVRLMALDAAMGNLLWSQQLSQTEQSDFQRRWVGASPSYADGVLVCPTSTGAVVGVELATRSLLWGFCYNEDRSNSRAGMMAMARAWSTDNGSRWADGSLTIRDGRVLVTAPDSTWLHCLSLIDGRLLWKCARQDARRDDLYVACVHGDNVVLVGRTAVRAVRLADGRPAWGGRTVALPKQSLPGGRGFVSGDRYFLPLSSAEVVAIDLNDGKLVGSWKSRKGDVLGNLVCHRGKIVSQGAEGLAAYFQLDSITAEVDRRLAANTRDAEALSLKGEILLSGDKRGDAIASFRLAHELAPDDPEARELLRDCLLESLRTDFPAYRSRISEIERLVDDASQRAALLRATACGLRQVGEWDAAFASYLKLADLESDRRSLEQIDATLSVRRDRWVRNQLAELRKQASPAAAAAIDKALQARLETAQAAHSLERLQAFLACFGDQPATAEASEELIRKLRGAGRLLEAELASGGKDAQGRAAGQTVATPDKEITWPSGKIEVKTRRTNSVAGVNYTSVPVLWEGPHPLFANLSLRFDNNRSAIIACDQYGRERWQVSLREVGPRDDSANLGNHACAFGHLLLVSLGGKMVAIDALTAGRKEGPRVFWSQDVLGSPREVETIAGNPALMMRFRRRFGRVDSFSVSSSLSNRQICVQRPRELLALDPATGGTLWIRRGVLPGSEVFGDDRYLFVISPDREDATVLNACDGELVGTRKIPRRSVTQHLPGGETRVAFEPLRQSVLTTFGRNMLLWWVEGHRRVLTLVDPLEGRDIWKGWKFATSARASLAGQDAVGVMEPSGHFMLVSLPDGRVIADVRLQAEPGLQEIRLLHDGDRYFLLTRGGPGIGQTLPLQPMPSAAPQEYSPIHRGRLYAFDSQGKQLWPAPVAIENQLLLSNQLPGLPVIVFACQRIEQANGQARWKPALFCVDKRTGQTVSKTDFNQQMIGLFGVRCEPEKKTVELVVQNDTVTLTFTDKPTTPVPAGGQPAKPSPARKTSSPARS